MRIPQTIPLRGRVKSISVPRIGYRWSGAVEVSVNKTEVVLLMAGTVAQWLRPGEEVVLKVLSDPKPVDGRLVLERSDYMLWRVWGGEEVLIWPPWSREFRLQRKDPLGKGVVYEYRVLAREAVTERDYLEIVQLEQYHYASKEEVVAVWRCPVCGRYAEGNVPPKCPEHGVPMKLHEIRASLPSSRFLILELVSRKEYEPRVVGYVRMDTPIPLMSRRLPDGKIERLVRERFFPKSWFHPTFWPEALTKRSELLRRYRELYSIYGSRKIARAALGEEIWEEALKWANTAAARVARVVIHPDYRGDGLGVLAVEAAIQWVSERRVPEMKKRKHIIEVIAQMARYNPFFEKAGFKYMWDTASGRPVLMYPLSDEARERIENYLKTDLLGRSHGGKLYRPRFGAVESLASPIVLEGVSKEYSSELDISGMPPELQEVLRAFGVEKRRVERFVLRDVNITIEPGDVIAVIGASGAGKTTLLRIICGAAAGMDDPAYRPSKGQVRTPDNARVAALLPGEIEPVFGEETLLEHVTKKVGDPATAVEILSYVGLSDAVFFRARFKELSTGQKERAKLASLLAERPNLIIIDEFTAHLDTLTATRVARKIGKILREAGITGIIATNRPEVLEALSPTKVLLVGYGTVTQLGKQ